MTKSKTVTETIVPYGVIFVSATCYSIAFQSWQAPYGFSLQFLALGLIISSYIFPFQQFKTLKEYGFKAPKKKISKIVEALGYIIFICSIFLHK